MLKSQLAQALQLPKHERAELNVFLRSLDPHDLNACGDDPDCEILIAGLRARLATRPA